MCGSIMIFVGDSERQTDSNTGILEKISSLAKYWIASLQSPQIHQDDPADQVPENRLSQWQAILTSTEKVLLFVNYRTFQF